ncbi:RNA polymerase I associated factor, A49-like protein [Martensiomyces pterosporus]|nr:RNA polymerase I associated factor, A49-like protein [Martensiomyces pterosporus]
MGSKRKSMSGESSQNSDVKITVDNTIASIQPVLATFAATVPPVASSFTTYKSVDPDRSDDCIVVSETDKIEFVGQNFEDDKALYTGCKYLVGVYDKETDTVTFRRAPLVRVNTVIKSLKDSRGVADHDIGSHVMQARNELGEAFGNKKRKAQIRAEERNKINMDTVKGGADIIEASIESRTSSMPSAKDMADAEDRPVPKYDPSATVASEVYDMDDVLSKADSLNINVTSFVGATGPEDYAQYIPVRSTFVSKKIEGILDQTKPDLLMLRRALFLGYLMKFATLSRKMLQNRESCIHALRCSPEIGDIVFEKFAECVAGSINPDGSPVYMKTTATESKLICHVAVLMLSLSNWVLYPAEMAADLGIPSKKAEKYLESVGCKMEPVSAEELAKHTFNKRARSGTAKKAVLKAPITFPKAKLRGN